MEHLFNIMLDKANITGNVWIEFNPDVNDGMYMEDTGDDGTGDDSDVMLDENGKWCPPQLRDEEVYTGYERTEW